MYEVTKSLASFIRALLEKACQFFAPFQINVQTPALLLQSVCTSVTPGAPRCSFHSRPPLQSSD